MGSGCSGNIDSSGKPFFLGSNPQERKQNFESKNKWHLYHEFRVDCSPERLMHIIPMNIDWSEASKGPNG